MPFRRPISIFAFLLAFTAAPAKSPDSAAWQEATRALDRLARQHREAQSFRLQFESRAVGADGSLLPASRGTLLSADSGRFRLDHPGGAVVSDGVTLWQYFPANKQVIVKEASEAGEAGGVLSRFLEAKPLRAERIGSNPLRVALDPASVGQNLDSLILTLDPDRPSVLSVETQDPAGNRVTYAVKSLRYGVRTKPGDFVFRAPPGVETVDMR